jgi:hypothetical protein
MPKSGGFASALKSRRPASLPPSGQAGGGRYEGYAWVEAVAELMVAGMLTDWPS